VDRGPAGPDPALLAKLRAIEQNDARGTSGLPTTMGPIGSFGSVVPRPHSFCGDVYELQPDTSQLPDFRNLEPIGSIYTESLLVPDQIFVGTNGIPGVTDHTTWFGVDYRAAFWIRAPGKYEFKLTSDDGVLLQIDDQRIIDIDGLHPALTQTPKSSSPRDGIPCTFPITKECPMPSL
jgi:PA14 domain-containing protein